MSRKLGKLSFYSKEKLAAGGCETKEGLKHSHNNSNTDLDTDSTDDHEILKGCDRIKESSTALELLHKERNENHIVSFCARIDEMIGGGISVGQITEFCGPPGIGKTQLCIQLAVDATIPVVFGGCGGQAIYIDTEGSFVIERVVQIAMATVSHIQSVAQDNKDQSLTDEADHYTLDEILKRIHYFRCHNYVQLLALSNILHQTILELGDKVCLVIVDNIASPFRYEFKDISMRHRLLSGLAQNFIKVANQFKVAVVLTNQMTNRSQSHSGNSDNLIPSLGESWAHVCTVRIILYWKETQRKALLYKSSSHREQVASYQITSEGIRDVFSTELTNENLGTSGAQADQDYTINASIEQPPHKKSRVD